MDWPLPPGPLVVASVNCPEDMRWARSAERIADHCDVLEWRLDGLQDAPVAEVAAALARRSATLTPAYPNSANTGAISSGSPGAWTE